MRAQCGQCGVEMRPVTTHFMFKCPKCGHTEDASDLLADRRFLGGFQQLVSHPKPPLETCPYCDRRYKDRGQDSCKGCGAPPLAPRL